MQSVHLVDKELPLLLEFVRPQLQVLELEHLPLPLAQG